MGKLTSMHFAGWKMGLKTGMYYLRTMAASAPIQFTVDQEQLKVEDTNVARSKKRVPGSGATSYAAIPRASAPDVATPAQEAPRTVVVEATIPAEAEAKTDGEAVKSEADIYSEAVLQCSIDNKEDCLMCSG